MQATEERNAQASSHHCDQVWDMTFGAGIGAGNNGKDLSQTEALILACIAYYQPNNRSELSSFFGKGGQPRYLHASARD